jgi:transketolase
MSNGTNHPGGYFNRGNRATKEGFGEGVLHAGNMNPQVYGLGVDITASVGMNLFANQHPKRFLTLGIAEQNAIGVAVGLAQEHKIPVFATYGVFAALRTTDQIRVSVCYNNVHVVIGGAHAGVSVGPDGATHQALEDIAIMRILPNMTVVSPCDATQTRLATIEAILHQKGPVYLRFGRAPRPDFTTDNQDFTIGKAQIMHPGDDITIVATGHLVWEALQAALGLSKEGIGVRVINLHTIKPIDKQALIDAARETGKIITAEEHQVAGGMGSAVAEVLAAYCPVPIIFTGMNDAFGESGAPDALMQKYGMTAGHLAQIVRKALR